MAETIVDETGEHGEDAGYEITLDGDTVSIETNKGTEVEASVAEVEEMIEFAENADADEYEDIGGYTLRGQDAESRWGADILTEGATDMAVTPFGLAVENGEHVASFETEHLRAVVEAASAEA